TTPQPPGPTQGSPNSGGPNGNWLIYYGSVANATTSQANDGICPSGGCPFGNINDISDLRVGYTSSQAIDCSVTAIGNTAKACYFPTSARLGIDNDNVTVVSSTYNDNLPLAERSIDPTVGFAAFAGTRVRVFKKAAIYSGMTSTPGCTSEPGVCPGSAQSSPQIQGDFYDLWSGLPFAIDPAIPQSINGFPVNLPGLNYEPVHVRGRSLASFNGNANLDGGFTNLLGALWVQ